MAAHRAADRLGRTETQTTTPLTVRLTSLSPATVPRKGPLRMRGTVRNDSPEVWQDINVDSFVSTSPITSAEELAAAAHTPYDDEVGTRLITSNAFVGIGDLQPGQSATFALRIPRDELPIPDKAGVYWVGAHALGTNTTGRDAVADGRARTFIPLYRAKSPRATVDLVVPLRAEVRRDETGALRNLPRWSALVGPQGRLDRVVEFAESAGTDLLSLVVDPALLDAVDTLRTGPIDPAGGPPPPTPSGGTSQSPSPGASPSGSPSASSDPSQGSSTDPGDDTDGTADNPTAALARDWLDRVTVLAKDQDVLSTGYADPDVAALAEHDPDLLDRAYAVAKGTFRGYGIQTRNVAAPADGYLPGSALERLGGSDTVLLNDHGNGTRRAAWRTTAGQSLVFGDFETSSGGPGPGPRTGALALRQRIVCAAALRGRSRSTSPVVVVLPPSWDPGPRWKAARFFDALDLPWLRLGRLPADPRAPVRQNLAFPASARKAMLSSATVAAARSLVDQAHLYAHTLTRPAGVVDGLSRLALQSTSYHARADDTIARLEALGLRSAIHARLARIRVVVQPLVSMSGGSGKIVVTLVNDLDKRVRVGLRAATDDAGLSITTPKSVTLPPGQRTTVRLPAKAAEAGVHQVTLSPVTDGGDKVGTPITFTVRSNQVGSLIWTIMAAGGALLLVMIARRWIKRGLRRRSAAP